MNKYIKIMIRKIFPKELPKHLGRWKLENCNIQINQKIDLSNKDHSYDYSTKYELLNIKCIEKK